MMCEPRHLAGEIFGTHEQLWIRRTRRRCIDDVVHQDRHWAVVRGGGRGGESRHDEKERPQHPCRSYGSATVVRGRMSRKLAIAVFAGLLLAPSAAARPMLVMPGVTYERVLQWT